MSLLCPTLRDVIGTKLLATYREFNIPATAMTNNVMSMLDHMQRIYGRKWTGDVPALALPLYVCENPASDDTIRAEKSCEGLIAVWPNAFLLGRERPWAFSSSCACEKTVTTTMRRMTVLTKEPATPFLLLRPLNECPVAISPHLPKASLLQQLAILNALEGALAKAQHSDFGESQLTLLSA